MLVKSGEALSRSQENRGVQKSTIQWLSGQQGLLRVPATWQVDEPGDLFHRVKYIYAGRAFYQRGSQRIPLRPGHLYIFPANKPYRLFQDTFKRPVFMYFHVVINPDFHNELIALPVKPRTTLHALIKLMESVLRYHEISQAVLEPLIRELFVLIDSAVSLELPSDARVTAAVNFLQQHFQEKVSIARLAESQGLEKAYFIRLFHRYAGVSPAQYLLRYRISIAKGLLLRDMPVHEAAAHAGFCDEKFFSRVFHRIERVPPSRYKESQFFSL